MAMATAARMSAFPEEPVPGSTDQTSRPVTALVVTVKFVFKLLDLVAQALDDVEPDKSHVTKLTHLVSPTLFQVPACPHSDAGDCVDRVTAKGACFVLHRLLTRIHRTRKQREIGHLLLSRLEPRCSCPYSHPRLDYGLPCPLSNPGSNRSVLLRQ